MFVCASACANAIQTKPHRLKLLILYSKKKSQNKSSKFIKMEKRATFLTLIRQCQLVGRTCSCKPQYLVYPLTVRYGPMPLVLLPPVLLQTRLDIITLSSPHGRYYGSVLVSELLAVTSPLVWKLELAVLVVTCLNLAVHLTRYLHPALGYSVLKLTDQQKRLLTVTQNGGCRSAWLMLFYTGEGTRQRPVLEAYDGRLCDR